MACFGSKVIRSRRVDTSQMAGEDNLSKSTGRKKGKNRGPRKEYHGADKIQSKGNFIGRQNEENDKDQNLSKLHNKSEKPRTALSKRVDPETAKYFSEIANLFEGGGLEVDERSVICGNALEESRGKELELATDMILSRTLQTLLEGCDVDHLCSFLLSCAKDFPLIAMDKSGSHVAETALKSLALHLEDQDVFTMIEETITKICEVVAERPVDVMSDCYGSHVIRSLLCLCKGVALQSLEEFHVTKSAIILAERLNCGLPKSGVNQLPNSHLGFPHLLKFLVRGLLQHSKESLKDLCVNKYSSLVLQSNHCAGFEIFDALLWRPMNCNLVDWSEDLLSKTGLDSLVLICLELFDFWLDFKIFDHVVFKFIINSSDHGSFLNNCLCSLSYAEVLICIAMVLSLQVALKLLAGNDEELMHVIRLLLGYKDESNAEEKLMKISTIAGNNDLIQDNSYSHLMEVFFSPLCLQYPGYFAKDELNLPSCFVPFLFQFCF